MNLEPANCATEIAAALHQALIDEVKAKGVLHTPAIEAALRAIPRHLFVPDVPLAEVYRDQHLVTKRRNDQVVSTSSQPMMMAIMLEQLAPEPGHKVLEIGAGTGYNAALLAHIVGEQGQVVTVDVDEDIVEEARAHLAVVGSDAVQVICRDGAQGHQDAAPYDRIILTVGVPDIVPAWYQQLKVGGRLVVPLAWRVDFASIAFEKVGNRLESRAFQPGQFVPLRGEFAVPPARPTQIGPEPGVTLQFIDERTVDTAALHQWLHGNHQDWETGIQVTLQEVGPGLMSWLAIREPAWGALKITGELADANIATPLVRMAGAEETLWLGILLDQAGLAALVRPSGDVAPVVSANAPPASVPPFDLNVRSFGADESVAHRLVQQIQTWDRDGRPSIDSMWIHAYPKDALFTPPDDATVIERKWTQLVIGWR